RGGTVRFGPRCRCGAWNLYPGQAFLSVVPSALRSDRAARECSFAPRSLAWMVLVLPTDVDTSPARRLLRYLLASLASLREVVWKVCARRITLEETVVPREAAR